MLRITFIALSYLLIGTSFGQYNWKLEKDKNGIKVYSSDMSNSSFKAVKVECTLTGSYTKLVSILTRVSQFSKWIYNTKLSSLVRQTTPHDFIYYSETHLPWPLSNRDAVIHLRIRTDSLPRVLTIMGSGVPDLVPEIPGKVRVSKYAASWKVTMPTATTIKIYYVLELNPGGSIPAWVANSFSDKGPFETFSNLAELLKK
jgi:START domain